MHLIIYFASSERVCALLLKRWDVVLEMERALKVLYDTTISLQNEKHTLSDFYGDWVLAKIKLEKLAKKPSSSKIAARLSDAIANRKAQLFEKSMMLCAIALDPRFCTVLSNDQKMQAKVELNKLLQRLKAMSQTTENSVLESSNNENSVNDVTLLEKFVFGKATECETDTHILNFQDIGSELESFISAQKEFPKDTTIDYHILNRNKYPNLFELAMVIFAVAPTQVVVERAFSVLSYIFNDRRTQLTSRMLEDILMICLNEDLFHQVNKEDMLELKTRN